MDPATNEFDNDYEWVSWYVEDEENEAFWHRWWGENELQAQPTGSADQ